MPTQVYPTDCRRAHQAITHLVSQGFGSNNQVVVTYPEVTFFS